MSRDFTSTMTWFYVESINYPSTEGTPLQMLNYTRLSIISLDQFSKPEQHVFRQMEEPADIVWNEFGQLASIQQSRE